VKTYLLAGAILLGAPLTAAAQQPQDTVQLPELVVTATRLPTPIADAPGSVTVLTGESMRRSGQRFLIDALRTVPGVTFAQSAGPGALTSMFIRGGESDYVQVLVDGIQINDPGGSFDWAHLRTEDIERVEIVRGPASVLYGSDAVSGVVQIFTREGGAPRIEAALTSSRGDKSGDGAGGSYDTHALDASLTGSSPLSSSGRTMLRYGLSAAHAASTGLYAFNSDYDNTNVAGRIHLDSHRGDIAFSARTLDSEYHFPTNGSGAVVDRNQFATHRSRSIGVDAGYRVIEPVELRVLATLHDTEARSEDPPDGDEVDEYWSTTDQLRRSIDARINIDMSRAGMLTLVGEREWQEAQTAFESLSEFGTFTDATDESRANTGWYAQLHGTPLRAVTITLGARIDDNAKFGTFRTGRAALAWQPVTPLRVHGSFGTAFKEPTFFENFATGYARGNPDLVPEQTRSGEVGAEVTLVEGALSFGATWFDQRFRNLIQYTYNTPTPDDPNYYNIGAARARGLELTASATLRSLRATASYTRTDTRVSDDGFGEDPAFQEDQRLLRRPLHQAAIHTSLRVSPSLTARVDGRIVGEREDLDFSDPAQWSGYRTTLPGYGVVDAGVVYGLVRGNGPAIDLSAGVRNLLDRRFQEIHNFPAAGRVLYAGVRAGLGL
jgi:vitamin B12 transporter